MPEKSSVLSRQNTLGPDVWAFEWTAPCCHSQNGEQTDLKPDEQWGTSSVSYTH